MTNPLLQIITFCVWTISLCNPAIPDPQRVPVPADTLVDGVGDSFNEKDNLRLTTVREKCTDDDQGRKPVAKLGTSTGGTIYRNIFRAQRGIYVTIWEKEDIQSFCEVIQYDVVRVSGDSDPKRVVNRGGEFNADTKALVSRAKAGDTYHIIDIRVRCPGDDGYGGVNSMAFELK